MRGTLGGSAYRNTAQEKKNDKGPGRTNSNIFKIFSNIFKFFASKKLAKHSQVQNFGGGRIKPRCFNQNFSDWQIRLSQTHLVLKENKTSITHCYARMVILFSVDSRLSSHSWFSAHNWTSSFLLGLGSYIVLRPLFFFLFFFALATACATCAGFHICDAKRMSRWGHLFSKMLPVTRLRIRVIDIRMIVPLNFLISLEITVKSVRWTRKKLFCPAIALSKLDQSYFPS